MKFLMLPVMTITTFLSVSSLADTIELQDEQILKGKLISINQNIVDFELAGQRLKIERSNVKSISFSTPAISHASPVVATTQKGGEVIIPAATPMTVKMMETINSSKHAKGHKFKAQLESAITVDNNVVIPEGTLVYGVITASKQSSRLVGKSNMQITFTDIMLDNKLLPIKTGGIKAVTTSTTKSTVARTARFAALGGLANGSEGAENMAKAGVGISLLTKGNTVNIPTGTLLEFTLQAPLSL